METRSNHVLVGTVVLLLLAGLLLFTVWLAGLSNKASKCFDIYFSQGVGGLNKGSSVSFSGVPVGEIKQISLLPDRPEFVWVRIDVDAGGLGVADLEQQRLLELEAAIAGPGRGVAAVFAQLGPRGASFAVHAHARASRSASVSAAISRWVTVSVTATTRPFASAGSAG